MTSPKNDDEIRKIRDTNHPTFIGNMSCQCTDCQRLPALREFLEQKYKEQVVTEEIPGSKPRQIYDRYAGRYRMHYDVPPSWHHHSDLGPKLRSLLEACRLAQTELHCPQALKAINDKIPVPMILLTDDNELYYVLSFGTELATPESDDYVWGYFSTRQQCVEKHVYQSRGYIVLRWLATVGGQSDSPGDFSFHLPEKHLLFTQMKPAVEHLLLRQREKWIEQRNYCRGRTKSVKERRLRKMVYEWSRWSTVDARKSYLRQGCSERGEVTALLESTEVEVLSEPFIDWKYPLEQFPDLELSVLFDSEGVPRYQPASSAEVKITQLTPLLKWVEYERTTVASQKKLLDGCWQRFEQACKEDLENPCAKEYHMVKTNLPIYQAVLAGKSDTALLFGLTDVPLDEIKRRADHCAQKKAELLAEHEQQASAKWETQRQRLQALEAEYHSEERRLSEMIEQFDLSLRNLQYSRFSSC